MNNKSIVKVGQLPSQSQPANFKVTNIPRIINRKPRSNSVKETDTVLFTPISNQVDEIRDFLTQPPKKRPISNSSSPIPDDTQANEIAKSLLPLLEVMDWAN